MRSTDDQRGKLDSEGVQDRPTRENFCQTAKSARAPSQPRHRPIPFTVFAGRRCGPHFEAFHSREKDSHIYRRVLVPQLDFGLECCTASRYQPVTIGNSFSYASQMCMYNRTQTAKIHILTTTQFVSVQLEGVK